MGSCPSSEPQEIQLPRGESAEAGLTWYVGASTLMGAWCHPVPSWKLLEEFRASGSWIQPSKRQHGRSCCCKLQGAAAEETEDRESRLRQGRRAAHGHGCPCSHKSFQHANSMERVSSDWSARYTEVHHGGHITKTHKNESGRQNKQPVACSRRMRGHFERSVQSLALRGLVCAQGPFTSGVNEGHMVL